MGKKFHQKLSVKEKQINKFKNIDFSAMKKQIINEITIPLNNDSFQNDSISFPIQIKNLSKPSHINILKEYEKSYNLYLTEEYNSRCVSMAISYLNKAKTLPEEFKNEANFQKEFIYIIQQLMFNEIEISLFTLFIDYIGWKDENYNHKIHLIFIGLKTKILLNQTAQMFILKFCNDDKNFMPKFKKWQENRKEALLHKFQMLEINERYRLLNKPHNTYCKKNFIDFNGVVDKIVQLSQPYGEENQGNLIKETIFGDSQIFDNNKDNNNKDNNNNNNKINNNKINNNNNNLENNNIIDINQIFKNSDNNNINNINNINNVNINNINNNEENNNFNKNDNNNNINIKNDSNITFDDINSKSNINNINNNNNNNIYINNNSINPFLSRIPSVFGFNENNNLMFEKSNENFFGSNLNLGIDNKSSFFKGQFSNMSHMNQDIRILRGESYNSFNLLNNNNSNNNNNNKISNSNNSNNSKK